MGLARPCTGPVPSTAVGGRAQQLRQLLKGRHPKLHHRLPPAVPFSIGSRLPPAGEVARMRTDDVALLSQTALGRLQLRVRRRECLGRASADVDGSSRGAAAELAAPSELGKRRAELVQQLIAAATAPVDQRPVKRRRPSPSEPPAASSVAAALAPVVASTSHTVEPPRAGRSQPLAVALAPAVAMAAATADPPRAGHVSRSQTPPGPAERAKRHRRSHPALSRSSVAPLPVPRPPPGAPSASTGRADSRWGLSVHEPSEADSDDCEADPKRRRASAGAPRAWQPPQLPRCGTKRAREPLLAGAAAHPRSPSGARGRRRRTG